MDAPVLVHHKLPTIGLAHVLQRFWCLLWFCTHGDRFFQNVAVCMRNDLKTANENQTEGCRVNMVSDVLSLILPVSHSLQLDFHHLPKYPYEYY